MGKHVHELSFQTISYLYWHPPKSNLLITHRSPPRKISYWLGSNLGDQTQEEMCSLHRAPGHGIKLNYFPKIPREMLQKIPNKYKIGSLLSAKGCSFPVGNTMIYFNEFMSPVSGCQPTQLEVVCCLATLCFASIHVVELSMWSPNTSLVLKVPFSTLFFFLRWGILP